MSKQACKVSRCTRRADKSGRCWSHRGHELARGPGPERKTEMTRVNRKRRAKSFARCYESAARLEWLKSGGCEVYREVLGPGGWACDLAFWPDRDMCFGPLDPAHVRARGMGGVKGDADDLVCLCRRHHQASGELGTTQRRDFERRYGLDLQALARKRAQEWRARAEREGRPA